MIATALAFLLALPALQEAAPVEELAGRIREQLEQVDRALLEAAEEERPAELVERARLAHLSAIRDLEELIRQVKYTSCSQGPAGGGSSSTGSGEADPQAAPRPADGESAPKPEAGGAGGQPEPAPQDGETEAGAQAGAQERTGGKAGSEGAEQREGRAKPPDPTGSFTRQDTDARWGLLPPKLQERLMNLHVDDVPERYRAWMDAYIRALNRQDRP